MVFVKSSRFKLQFRQKTILFSLLHFLPILNSPLRISEKPFIFLLTGESFRRGIFLKFGSSKFCSSVFQWQISSLGIYLSLLLITSAPKSFWILFYISKVILKLHLDSKIQIILAYYLYYKRDLIYCQTLWPWKCQIIYTDCGNNCMLCSIH